MACTQATKYVLWLKRLLGEVGYKQEKTIIIHIVITDETWHC